MENLIRKLQTAEEKYAQVVFNTNVPFNDPAPKPVVAFGIGGVSSKSRMFLALRTNR